MARLKLSAFALMLRQAAARSAATVSLGTPPVAPERARGVELAKLWPTSPRFHGSAGERPSFKQCSESSLPLDHMVALGPYKRRLLRLTSLYPQLRGMAFYCTTFRCRREVSQNNAMRTLFSLSIEAGVPNFLEPGGFADQVLTH